MGSLWLTHHPPAEWDRCVHAGPVRVCRRCVLLWPLVYAFVGFQIALRAPAYHPLDWALPLLLLPPVVEYVAVHIEAWRYQARRTYWLTPMLALGLGRLFYRYACSPFDDVTLAALAAVALPCAWAAWHHANTRVVSLPPEVDPPAKP